MSRRHLTQKQNEFLKFLQTYVEEQDVWPTYREAVEHFGYRSPNSVTQNLRALLKKGYLERDKHGYRLKSARARAEGGVPVRGAFRRGRLDTNMDESESVLSLTTLFPELEEAYAYATAGQQNEEGPLTGCQYVFAKEAPLQDGDTAVVLTEARQIGLRHVSGAGDARELAPLDAAATSAVADVLGRYVGHAGQGEIHVAPSASVRSRAA